MTPMNPKDRPKVMALGGLSVLMLGFFVSNVMGAMAKHQQNGAPPLTVVKSIGEVPPPAPTTAPPGPAVVATVSPFGKPSGTGAETTLSGTPVAGEAISGPSDPFRHVLPDFATLQRMQEAANRPPATHTKNPGMMSGSLPAATAGGVTIAAVVPPDPTIRLDGIVTDHDRYAMVTYNDRTDMYHVGSRIAGVFTVVGVTSEGASIRGPKGVFRLDVGEERSATAPVPKEPKATVKPAGLHRDSRPQDFAEYAALPMPSAEGPAAGRGH